MENLKILKVPVGGIGAIRLDANDDGTYSAFDEQGLLLGTLNPQEIPDWTEDEYALSAILEDLFDNGELILPYSDKEYYGDDV